MLGNFPVQAGEFRVAGCLGFLGLLFRLELVGVGVGGEFEPRMLRREEPVSQDKELAG